MVIGEGDKIPFWLIGDKTSVWQGVKMAVWRRDCLGLNQVSQTEVVLNDPRALAFPCKVSVSLRPKVRKNLRLGLTLVSSF